VIPAHELEPLEKRSKTEGRYTLAQDADFPAIEEWLEWVKTQEESQRYLLITTVFQTYPSVLVEKLLEFFSVVDLFRLISLNTFKVMRSLAEFIRLELDAHENVSQKLLMISRKILSSHRMIAI